MNENAPPLCCPIPAVSSQKLYLLHHTRGLQFLLVALRVAAGGPGSVSESFSGRFPFPGRLGRLSRDSSSLFISRSPENLSS
jgi:hypothetical protein